MATTATDHLQILIDNDQLTLSDVLRQARLELDTAHEAEEVVSGTWTVEEAQRFLLADALRGYIEDEIDDMPVQRFRDALRAQLARHAFELIDWHELADYYLTKAREGTTA